MQILILDHECSQQLTRNHQEVKTIHVSISYEWINEIWSIHPVKYYSAIKLPKKKKKEQTTDIVNNTDDSWKQYAK